jgi:hypothetical protein
MAYFSNGSSGDRYMENWCERCRNFKRREDEDTEGCPIWDLHLMYNYNENELHAKMRDHFIPMDKKYNPQQCRMFETTGECRGQMKF